MKQFIRKLKKLIQPANEVSFPYIYNQPEFNLRFKINNQIEEFRLKEWGGEKEYVSEVLGDLKKDDVFYDVGASVGLFSTIAAKVLTEGHVVSFEPDPENLKCLKENLQLNDLKNFSAQHLAVGERSGKMKLYTAGSNAFSPSLQKVNGIDSFIEVDVRSVDELLASENLPFPTVVKIDIEGAEMIALKGMFKTLSSKNRPRMLLIEIHPDFLPAFDSSPEEILEYLEKLNYSLAEKTQRENQILCKLVSESSVG